MINSRFLLGITFVSISIIYYFLFTLNEIIEIVKDEYIVILIAFFMICIYVFFQKRLQGKILYEFIPTSEYVSIKSTIVFFVIFEAIDYYYEGGFVGMVKLWVSYWFFGVIAYFLTYNINFYKNYIAYSKAGKL